MAHLAAQVLLHPKLTQSLAVLATTVGRDKTYRLIQYLARLIAWSLLRNGSVDAAKRWDGLKAGLASGRKLMRLFKPIEHLQSALNLAGRPIVSKTATPASQLAHTSQLTRQVAYAGYLTTDMLVWLNSVKFLRFEPERLARLVEVSNKCWLAGITLSLISSTASLVSLRADSRRLALAAEIARREGTHEKEGPLSATPSEDERRAKGRAMIQQRQMLLSQFVMDSFDFVIPANNLGYTHFSDGVVGALGAATSYMALQQQWLKVNGAAARKA